MEITIKREEGYIELIKLLKLTRLCATGGEAKTAVAKGLVRVDGQVEFRKKRKVRAGQRVEFDGNAVSVSLFRI